MECNMYITLDSHDLPCHVLIKQQSKELNHQCIVIGRDKTAQGVHYLIHSNIIATRQVLIT